MGGVPPPPPRLNGRTGARPVLAVPRIAVLGSASPQVGHWYDFYPGAPWFYVIRAGDRVPCLGY